MCRILLVSPPVRPSGVMSNPFYETQSFDHAQNPAPTAISTPRTGSMVRPGITP